MRGMPMGIYECDYCNKEFKDTPSTRRRHLLGIQHQRAKAIWFVWILIKLFSKGQELEFAIGGFCQYGDSCKYFYPKQNAPITIGQGNTQEPVFWGNQVVGADSLPGSVVQDRMGISWGNLPPSLQPPPEGEYPLPPFIEWG